MKADSAVRTVPFFKHSLGPREIAKVQEALEGPILTTGNLVEDFERQFADYLGAGYCAGLTSCTAALQLALLASGVGPGDEVITTPLTFVATANAILQVGAQPVFVNVEQQTGNIDAELIEEAISPRTRAILPVHLYGQMCDMKAIKGIADRHDLVVVEDAAHALESERDGVRTGQLADIACFSFYATKSITSGEGGAATTNAPETVERIKKLRSHGMDLHAVDRFRDRYRHWDVDCLGWKYNMDNIQAALLLPQLLDIEENWRRREEICRRYESAFGGVDDLDFPKVLSGSKSSRHLFTIWVAPERRDVLLTKLHQRGVGVTVNYRPIHLLTYYRRTFEYGEGMFPISERIGGSTISLPLYPKLSDEEVDYVIKVVTETATKG